MGIQDSKVILIIDDDESVREAVTDILDIDGWHVISAADGWSGVSLYKARYADIALVILDLTMPGINGLETLNRLRAFDPAVKVLLSSGYSEKEIQGRFDAVGATGFLHKPYNATRLMKAIRDHAQGR